ncbi:unnamed protein product [Parnassius mnemosyne]|uniref:Integrase catalytic domain-containing protein n=1 Tax=Parnassius mnemosyne TaxID=213953 RepID=A0AAV1LLE1_9NEOP
MLVHHGRVVMDYFTKWPEVFAISNEEASTVADKLLVHEVFCRFGVPLEIHSDQGRNFESQIFEETCRVMGTHKTRTTSYHPQSDGMVARFNQTLERYLAKVVKNGKETGTGIYNRFCCHIEALFTKVHQ